MANLNLKVDIKYHAVRKDGNKEVAQRIVNQTLYFPEITEAQFKAVIDYVETVTAVTELIGD